MLVSHIMLLIATFHLLRNAPGVSTLKCHECNEYNDETNCMETARDQIVECVSATTCVIATGIRTRKEDSIIKSGNIPLARQPRSTEPLMSRSCTIPRDAVEDAKDWAAAQTRGQKMVCYLITRPAVAPWINTGAVGAVHRRCICGEEKCNNRVWDDVMVQPVMPVNGTSSDIPAVPTLGTNALNHILSLNLLNNASLDKGSTQSFDGGSDAAVSTSESLVGSTATAISTSDSGGVTTGLVAGAAVGAVILLGLIGGLICWMKVRRRRRRRREPTEDSGASADTQVGANDAVN